VARITLNRPDVLNSFDRDGPQPAADPGRGGPRCSLRGVPNRAGRAFCAGQDLVERRREDRVFDFGAHVRKL
jgi:enoyl-CoA hydratase/carnithine racemase